MVRAHSVPSTAAEVTEATNSMCITELLELQTNSSDTQLAETALQCIQETV